MVLNGERLLFLLHLLVVLAGVVDPLSEVLDLLDDLRRGVGQQSHAARRHALQASLTGGGGVNVWSDTGGRQQ